jgi:hypothetical protein
MTGTLTHTAADVIRYLLIDLSLGTLPTASSSWPISVGSEPDRPDSSITIYNETPISQGRHQIDGEIQERPGFQVRIRAGDQNTAHAKADAIRNAIDKTIVLSQVTISSSVYLIYSISRTSGPIYLGKDVPNSERHLITINATVALKQSS